MFFKILKGSKKFRDIILILIILSGVPVAAEQFLRKDVTIKNVILNFQTGQYDNSTVFRFFFLVTFELIILLLPTLMAIFVIQKMKYLQKWTSNLMLVIGLFIYIGVIIIAQVVLPFLKGEVSNSTALDYIILVKMIIPTLCLGFFDNEYSNAKSKLTGDNERFEPTFDTGSNVDAKILDGNVVVDEVSATTDSYFNKHISELNSKLDVTEQNVMYELLIQTANQYKKDVIAKKMIMSKKRKKRIMKKKSKRTS